MTSGIGASAALVRWMIAAPPDEMWLDVIELTHPNWPQGYVLINYPDPVAVRFETGRWVTATPVAFQVDLPDAGTDGRQDMSIAMDNVGAEMWNALELAQAAPEFPITVTWRAYLSKNLGEVQAVPVVLTVTNVSATSLAINLTASRTDIINRKWPRVFYRAERWPGLVR
jgi:uncharacterized protein DUF1833